MSAEEEVLLQRCRDLAGEERRVHTLCLSRDEWSAELRAQVSIDGSTRCVHVVTGPSELHVLRALYRVLYLMAYPTPPDEKPLRAWCQAHTEGLLRPVCTFVAHRLSGATREFRVHLGGSADRVTVCWDDNETADLRQEDVALAGIWNWMLHYFGADVAWFWEVRKGELRG